MKASLRTIASLSIAAGLVVLAACGSNDASSGSSNRVKNAALGASSTTQALPSNDDDQVVTNMTKFSTTSTTSTSVEPAPDSTTLAPANTSNASASTCTFTASTRSITWCKVATKWRITAQVSGKSVVVASGTSAGGTLTASLKNAKTATKVNVTLTFKDGTKVSASVPTNSQPISTTPR